MKGGSGFAALLDDLVDGEAVAPRRPRPQIPFGLFPDAGTSSAHSHAAPGFAAAGYADHEPPPFEPFPGAAEVRDPQILLESPLSLDPAAIAAELPLESVETAVLHRARRDFALRNHPDRSAIHLRDRAARRMQIANSLIDDALRRLAQARSS